MSVLGSGGSGSGDMAPSFVISINNNKIDDNITRLIQSVEYDSADNIADMMKLQVSNPNSVISDQKLFQPGNIIKLWIGFGDLEYIGAAIIEKTRPYFPSDGMRTIEVVAYSADRLLMRNAPDSSDELKPFLSEKEAQKKKEREHKKKVRGAPAFKGKSWGEDTFYSDVVADKAEEYSFGVDVDETPNNIIGPAGIIQKVGMTDYTFVAGIANELIWLFWVDMEEDETYWTLHLKDPDFISEIQDRKYTFRYDSITDGESEVGKWSGSSATTLLSFEGEQLMGEGPTNLSVQVKNYKTGNLETFGIVGDPAESSMEFTGIVDDSIEQPPGDSSEVSLSFGNVAVKVIADRQFQTAAHVKEWAEKWYQEHHRDYFSGGGTVRGPGVETLRAMQVHGMEGLGVMWSGDYYFTNVNHKVSSQDGYEVRWSGRKVVKTSSSEFTVGISNL